MRTYLAVGMTVENNELLVRSAEFTEDDSNTLRVLASATLDAPETQVCHNLNDKRGAVPPDRILIIKTGDNGVPVVIDDFSTY